MRRTRSPSDGVIVMLRLTTLTGRVAASASVVLETMRAMTIFIS